jgi:hypothetical protein
MIGDVSLSAAPLARRVAVMMNVAVVVRESGRHEPFRLLHDTK